MTTEEIKTAIESSPTLKEIAKILLTLNAEELKEAERKVKELLEKARTQEGIAWS